MKRTRHTTGKIAFFMLAVSLLRAGCATRVTQASNAWQVPPARDFITRLPPPPALHSKAMEANLNEVLALQSRATPEKIASARWTYDLSVFTYSLALDPTFTAAKYPATAKLFLRLNDLVCRVNTVVKDHFKAPHPFQVDSRVRRFVDAVPGFDYPSYHSARCAVFERVLSSLDPSRRKEFLAVSQRIEQDRVFAGEHFPFSILAGRNLGKMIYDDLMKDPRFRKDVSNLKASEWSPPLGSKNSF